MAKKKVVSGDGAGAHAKRKVEVVRGSDAPTYYVNNINIDLSSFDVRLRIGQIQGADDTTIQVKELAHVFMSHAHFRALVKAINTSAEKLRHMPVPVELAETERPH
jgi:hypothetical protein